MFDSLLAVTSAAGIDDSYSRTFAQQYGLSWLCANELETDTASRFTVVLSFDERGCCLKSLVDRKLSPVRASFIEGAVNHRRQFGGGKGQMIAKAVGLKGRCLPSVLDATAGLGRDGFVLATLGCHVQLLERSPAIAALLQAGVEEARHSPETSQIAARMSVEQVNSIDFLLAQEEAVADVIYLDPMFPHREKSSLVKKEMRIFRDIVGDDLDAQALLAAARDKARYRVVVKRPRKAPVIEGEAPSFSLEGKSSRYDIYTIRSLNEWQPQEG